MDYAVFIMPDKILYEEICRWKNKIKSEFLDSDHCYTSHPPHLTVFKFESRHKNKLLIEFSKFSKKLNAFNLDLDKMQELGVGIYRNPETGLLEAVSAPYATGVALAK